MGIKDSMSVWYRILGDKYRQPCYHGNGYVNCPSFVENDESKERMHFSAGLLQYHQAMGKFRPFIEFDPRNDDFPRLPQTQPRYWLLSKRLPSWLFRDRNIHQSESNIYRVKEETLCDRERRVLQDWQEHTHGALLQGSEPNDAEPDTILMKLKVYLQDIYN